MKKDNVFDILDARKERAGEESEYNDVEIGRLTEAEYELANLEHELFLERERADRERFDRDFELELDQLIKTIRPDEDKNSADDPSGWPEF
jgi:hypothetical protein